MERNTTHESNRYYLTKSVAAVVVLMMTDLIGNTWPQNVSLIKKKGKIQIEYLSCIYVKEIPNVLKGLT